MFSFFKKKPELSVRIKEYELSKFVAGMETTTDKRSIKKDAAALQKKFQLARSKIQEPSNPSGTIVISKNPDANGAFSYFIGDLVDSSTQHESLSVIELHPGKYAYITIDFKDPSELTFAVAKAKSYFFDKWLPTSNYHVRDDIESIELYDRRSSISLASMDLVFPLIEK